MNTDLETLLQKLPSGLSNAVAHYWTTRARQQQKQLQTGKSDQGARGAVTGGAQRDSFISLFAQFIEDAGIPGSCIHFKKALELPGYFRSTKEWDLIVVRTVLRTGMRSNCFQLFARLVCADTGLRRQRSEP